MYGNGALRGVGADAAVAGAFRRLHRWAFPDAVSVLSYHGLVDPQLPVPDRCFMPVERFAAQMEYLARHFTVLHLEEAFAPDRPRGGRPVACVTFDDGFSSVHDLALPVLERLSIPATVYLVTDLVDREGTIWFARLHQAICVTTAAEVGIGGHRFRLGSPREKAAASAGLQLALKRLERADFDAALAAVLDRLGFPDREPVAAWAPMRILRSEQIHRMGRNDLVRFGSHTASHQILTRTTPDDGRREVERSVAAIAALVERPSRTFAYPNGGPDDFDAGSVAALRSAGIEYAVMAIGGPNPRGVDPYRIRRYGIGAADSFARFAGQVHHTRAAAAAVLRRRPDERRASAGGI
jgi:peptidoglycan/xylan/chitin deacetylase (PgdA/CDA1 family)